MKGSVLMSNLAAALSLVSPPIALEASQTVESGTADDALFSFDEVLQSLANVTEDVAVEPERLTEQTSVVSEDTDETDAVNPSIVEGSDMDESLLGIGEANPQRKDPREQVVRNSDQDFPLIRQDRQTDTAVPKHLSGTTELPNKTNTLLDNAASERQQQSQIVEVKNVSPQQVANSQTGGSFVAKTMFDATVGRPSTEVAKAQFFALSDTDAVEKAAHTMPEVKAATGQITPQTMPQRTQAADADQSIKIAIAPSVPDDAQVLSGFADETSPTPPTSKTDALLARADTQTTVIRQVSQQVAYAISQTAAGTTEIQLSPEELGRVRMTIQTIEGVINVTVIAERAEVSDLMRRQGESLATQLKDMGFDTINLNFGNEAQGGSNETMEDQGEQALSFLSTQEEELIAPTAILSTTEALDIRM